MNKIFGFVLIVVIFSIIDNNHATNLMSTDIMSCVLCEMVSESVIETKPGTPAAALTTMYRYCNFIFINKTFIMEF